MQATYTELANLVEQLTAWAVTKGILGDGSVEPGYDEALVQGTFRAGLHAATKALQDRRVSYIGLNEANGSVVIYLEKVLRRSDRDVLANASHGNCVLEFYHAGMQAFGGPPSNTVSVSPYHEHNSQFYTCGSSVSVANEPTAGTLGCLLTDPTGQLYALSNNHVFAGSNYCDIGMQIIAPGQADIRANALDPFTIGHLHKAVPLSDGNPQIVDASANVDAAIIKISTAAARISSMQRDYYDTPTRTQSIQPNMVVEKVGRTTGRTTGVVSSYHPTPQAVRCIMAKLNSYKIVYFQNYWAVISQSGAFSQPGDSGSLVTTRDANGARCAVGLVFAGSADLSFIVSIEDILKYFAVTLVENHNV